MKVQIKQQFVVEGLTFDTFAEAEEHALRIELEKLLYPDGVDHRGASLYSIIPMFELIVKKRDEVAKLLQRKGWQDKVVDATPTPISAQHTDKDWVGRHGKRFPIVEPIVCMDRGSVDWGTTYNG